MTTHRSGPRILTVSRVRRVTPHMIRVTFEGPEISEITAGREGANCKLSLPEPNESRTEFEGRIVGGPAPVRRTYTISAHRPDQGEMDIDFVDHGDDGPASAWAVSAKPGDFLGFAGPGPLKVDHWDADFYVVAGDMSAFPLISATFRAMPPSAKGFAVLEVPSLADIQQFDVPVGIELKWVLNPTPHEASNLLVDEIVSLDWPKGKVQTCIAGEHSAIKALRSYVLGAKNVPAADAYISGYWKIGLIEDEHQSLKRSERD